MVATVYCVVCMAGSLTEKFLWSLNKGILMSWQNNPFLEPSRRFQDAFSFRDFGGPNSTPIIRPFTAHLS